MNNANSKIKIARIMATIKGAEFIHSIPVKLWITDPDKVKDDLRAASKLLNK